MAGAHTSVRMSDLTSLEAYNLLVATVIPRPIAFVSTISRSGIPNLAPFSFFMVGGSNPPSLIYSPTLNKLGEQKDSLRNVHESGEFVVNLVDRPMADGVNSTSIEFPAEESEWGTSGFTPAASHAVAPARVAESPVQFECRLHQIIPHGDGPYAAQYVIGEVLLAHLHPSIAADPVSLRLIGRMGGPDYFDTATGELFAMRRPTRR